MKKVMVVIMLAVVIMTTIAASKTTQLVAWPIFQHCSFLKHYKKFMVKVSIFAIKITGIEAFVKYLDMVEKEQSGWVDLDELYRIKFQQPSC